MLKHGINALGNTNCLIFLLAKGMFVPHHTSILVGNCQTALKDCINLSHGTIAMRLRTTNLPSSQSSNKFLSSHQGGSVLSLQLPTTTISNRTFHTIFLCGVNECTVQSQLDQNLNRTGYLQTVQIVKNTSDSPKSEVNEDVYQQMIMKNKQQQFRSTNT